MPEYRVQFVLNTNVPPDPTRPLDWLIFVEVVVCVVFLLCIAIFAIHPRSKEYIRTGSSPWAFILICTGAVCHITAAFVSNAHLNSYGWFEIMRNFYCPFWDIWIKFVFGFAVWYTGMINRLTHWLAVLAIMHPTSSNINQLSLDVFLGEDGMYGDGDEGGDTNSRNSETFIRRSAYNANVNDDYRDSANDVFRQYAGETEYGDGISHVRMSSRGSSRERLFYAKWKWFTLTFIILVAVGIASGASMVEHNSFNSELRMCMSTVSTHVALVIWLIGASVFMYYLLYKLHAATQSETLRERVAIQAVSTALLVAVICLVLLILINVSGIAVFWWGRAFDTSLVIFMYMFSILRLVGGDLLAYGYSKFAREATLNAVTNNIILDKLCRILLCIPCIDVLCCAPIVSCFGLTRSAQRGPTAIVLSHCLDNICLCMPCKYVSTCLNCIFCCGLNYNDHSLVPVMFDGNNNNNGDDGDDDYYYDDSNKSEIVVDGTYLGADSATNSLSGSGTMTSYPEVLSAGTRPRDVVCADSDSSVSHASKHSKHTKNVRHGQHTQHTIGFSGMGKTGGDNGGRLVPGVNDGMIDLKKILFQYNELLEEYDTFLVQNYNALLDDQGTGLVVSAKLQEILQERKELRKEDKFLGHWGVRNCRQKLLDLIKSKERDIHYNPYRLAPKKRCSHRPATMWPYEPTYC